MNKQIIIFTDIYYPHPMAGGICAHEIALALQTIGYQVHVICYKRKGEKPSEQFMGIQVHRIKSKLAILLRDSSQAVNNSKISQLLYEAAMFLNKLSKLLYLKWFPLTSPFLAMNYYQMAGRIAKNDNSVKILAIYSPIEAPLAAIWLNKRKKLDFVLYSLDSLSNSDGTNYLPIKWTNHKGWVWEKKIYHSAKGIVNLKCHEKHYRSFLYDEFREKMKIADIPLLRKFEISDKLTTVFLDSSNHWMYAGTLDTSIRSPRYVCDFFLALDQTKTRSLHFFSKGNCEAMLRDYEKESNGRIFRHGHRSIDEIHFEFSKADFLVSIGNHHSDFIPSKIFEYMATGKPIIHFYSQENDVCLPYLNKYPLAICLKENNDSLQENIKNYIRFEKIVANKTIPFDLLVTEYIENTPQYNAEVIDQLFYP